MRRTRRVEEDPLLGPVTTETVAVDLLAPNPGDLEHLSTLGVGEEESALAFAELAARAVLDETPPGSRRAREAQRALDRARDARLAIRHGNPAAAWLAGLDVGEALALCRVRRVEREVTLARKVRSAGAKTRRVRQEAGGLAAQHRETFEALAREVRQKRPDWGVTAIRDAVVELVQKRYTAVPCSRRTLERLKIPTM